MRHYPVVPSAVVAGGFGKTETAGSVSEPPGFDGLHLLTGRPLFLNGCSIYPTKKRSNQSHFLAGSERRNVSARMPTTMYYDGGCPMCRREVAHYRRLDHARRVRWLDISRDASELDSLGIPLGQAMARLHVRDPSGRLVSGAWAFAAVWDELPCYRWLARLVRALHLLPLMDIAYRRFADLRFRRRCAQGACAVDRNAPRHDAPNRRVDGHA